MNYARKLLLSKIIITLCWVAMVVPPIIFTFFGGSNGRVSEVAAKPTFLLSWLLIAHALYLPVLFYLLWGKLHGTGRSVRAVAFLGMGYAAAFFVAFSLRGRLKSDELSSAHFDALLDQGSHSGFSAGVLVLLVLATLLSVKK